MIAGDLNTDKQAHRGMHRRAAYLSQRSFFPPPLWARRNPIRTTSTASGGNSSQVGGESQVALLSNLVVAVPDASVQEMLRMALQLRGYQVNCTPIDRFHPIAWIGQARSLQPDAVIVDVDLFRNRSIQESIFTVVQAWEQGSWMQPSVWVWLSRRPVEGSVALRMPFRLAQLDEVLQGCGTQGIALPSNINTRNGFENLSHYD